MTTAWGSFPVSLRLSPDLLAQVEDLAAQRRWSKAQTMREAIAAGVQHLTLPPSPLGTSSEGAVTVTPPISRALITGHAFVGSGARCQYGGCHERPARHAVPTDPDLA